MGTRIIYTDEFGKIISDQQRSLLKRVKRISYMDNSIKMIETIGWGRNSGRKTIAYFLDSTEDKSGILHRYTNKSNNVNCLLYSNKQSAYGYNLWHWEQYSTKASLSFKGNVVYDSNHKLIMYCSFDLKTNLLQDGAWKNYYANKFENESDDQLLKISYDVDGNVSEIVDFNGAYGHIKGISLDEFLADTVFSQKEFPWDQHTYYHALMPYLPSSIHI